MANRKRKISFGKRKAAYWMGVGIASAHFKDSDNIMEHPNPDIRKAALAGQRAENYKNVSGRFGRN